MDLTLLGMFTEVNPLQSEKAALPMDVMLLGMLMEVSPLQEKKAVEPMDVTLNSIPLLVIIEGMET